MSDVKIFKCSDCAHECNLKMLLSDTGNGPDMCIVNRTIRDGYVNWEYQDKEPELIDKEELIERLEDIRNCENSYDLEYQLDDLIRVIKEGYLDA